MKAAFEKLNIEIYGESHAERIGVRVGGIEKGAILTLTDVYDLLNRRSATHDAWSTERREDDKPIFEGLRELGDGTYEVTGEINAYILNKDVKKEDYSAFCTVPRPSHADFVAWARDGRIASGGGRFSGRMTAAMCVAGGICKEILSKRGIKIDAYATNIGSVHFLGARDSKQIALYGISDKDRATLRERTLPVLDGDIDAAIDELIECEKSGDSVGGVIECVATGVGAGDIGEAMFEGLEGKLAYSLFAIPAVKGVEFGEGFEVAALHGSQVNDGFEFKDGKVRLLSNNCGGIDGGISNGMPIVMRAAFKPTPSIAKEQRSVDLATGEARALKFKGRYDVCVVPRTVTVVEAAVALAIYDEMAKYDKI